MWSTATDVEPQLMGPIAALTTITTTAAPSTATTGTTVAYTTTHAPATTTMTTAAGTATATKPTTAYYGCGWLRPPLTDPSLLPLRSDTERGPLIKQNHKHRPPTHRLPSGRRPSKHVSAWSCCHAAYAALASKRPGCGPTNRPTLMSTCVLALRG